MHQTAALTVHSMCTHCIFLLYMTTAALSDIDLRRLELWLIFIAGAVFKSCPSLCRNHLWCLMELTASRVVNVVRLTRAALL